MVVHPTAKVAFSRQQAFIAFLLLLMIVLNYLDRQILSVLAPVMRKELGFSQSQYAFAVNAFLLAYAFMYAGSGFILDRMGSRKGLAVFVTLWSIVCGLHVSIRGLASLVALRFLLGLAEPGGWTGAAKTVSERFTPAQRGMASGIFTTGAGIGAVIAPPLVVFISLTYGWRSAFLLASVAGLLWVPLWLRATKGQWDLAPSQTSREIREGRQRLSSLCNRRVLAYIWVRFFGDSSGYFFLFWLPEYLMTSKHFTFSMMGAFGWIPFFWTDVGALVGGYLSSKLVARGRLPLLSRKWLMSSAAVLVALGTVFQSSYSSIWIIVSLSLCNFGVGMWAGNLHAVPADAFPARLVATVHGLAGSAGAIGGILFNTLVGHFSAAGQYPVVFLTLALLQPLGIAGLWAWLREPAVDDPSAGAGDSQRAQGGLRRGDPIRGPAV